MKPFLLFCLLLLGVALGATPTFPDLTGRVVDQAGLLTPDQEKSLSDLSQSIEDNTTAQVVVVTLTSLEGYDIADYGNQLGRYWKLGQKEKNNGVLILLAPNEHKVRIEVGYGLEGEITDAQANELIQSQMLPRFKENDTYGGLINGMDGIKMILLKESPLQSQVEENSPEASALRNIFYGIAMSGIPFLIIAFLAGNHLSPKKFNTPLKWVSSIALGSIVGLLLWIVIHMLLVCIVVAVILTILIYFTDTESDFGTIIVKSNRHKDKRNSNHGSFFDIFSSSGGSGGFSGGSGGFSGGGGSFGGGGASGSW